MAASGSRAGYIPYSNRPLSWHTDGYYNFHGPSDCVKAMVLHCVRDADEGGVSALLDHEIAYIRLRDRDPAFIEALMHPEAMTIPAGEDGYGGPRPDNTGPVFFIDPESKSLVMRYTARKRHVMWREDAATQGAVNALEDVLESDPLVIRTNFALAKASSATTFCTTAQGSPGAQTETGASFTACVSTTGSAFRKPTRKACS